MSLDAFFSTSICYGAGAPGAGWTLALPITSPLAAIALIYALGAGRLWRRSGRGRPERLRQALLFAAGWSVLAVALVSPIHALGELVFSAHMIEHELLMAVAAPLLVAACPGAALMWALPTTLRRGTGNVTRGKVLQALWAFAARPLSATILHGIAIWIWHVPVLFEAALQQGVLHYAQHASFLGTALLFWWVLLPRSGREQTYGISVMHLFFTSLHTGLLGVLLLVSPKLWYPENASGAALWRLSPLEDQQLAGLVMWVPAGLIYGGAALLLAGLWISNSGTREAAHALRPG
ncbi:MULTISPECIES: cytochrome c oxidase assembly protein [unclassified Mesorhizobium]|uniref:cytochrome c oxidase assembly protein n=1 Tax=unclassified Mesorhizobium TaxID=325217 RepID=UPI000F75BE28|nr:MULTISPECIES: cytochrome c oxidase assembly protein [unclassified Mesorhizobium]AZO03087.1 cytochrome c oxidase assembly protein [Mesorhizobium sp. M2A.F.Ca.ET.043.02.1.1]RUW43396.1 cytochrome c oxidase assembly protein [Mesorhizobium sp. M2A.F.Ca.ET.015.02.1.1]RUW67409.1 cytochrome c oxidase assembly protein [Mesorhizobium sp. M2A.F.Ca.ET.067.02.1.1]RVC98254.1 cytochrome c oxidase assembly protein [Mesorhizobium sp. M2A.F.Ca.ET.017.03.2.1]RVD11901.1 cytochrome c oxidase assembly protein [M